MKRQQALSSPHSPSFSSSSFSSSSVKSKCQEQGRTCKSCTCTVIQPSEFNDRYGHPTVTLLITQPGNYCLGGNVAFSPTSAYQPAINILSDDVVLDLQGFTLSQAPNNAFTDCYGVLIGEGSNPHLVTNPNAVFSNITVKNGSIIGFTGVGVFCYNNSFNPANPPNAQVPFTCLNFHKLNVLNCGLTNQPNYYSSGINLDSQASDLFPNTPGNPVAFKYVTIDSCNVNGSMGNGSIGLFTFDDAVIRNTQANDMLTTQGYTIHENSSQGTYAWVLVGVNLQMYQCQGNGATDFSPPSQFNLHGGMSLQNSRNIIVKDCQFNDAFGEFIVESDIEINENSVFENCQFNNTRGGVVAYEAAGVQQGSFFTKTDEGTGARWINCQFNGASFDPANTTGFLVIGFASDCEKNLELEGCQACNIHSTCPTAFVGGFLAGTDVSDTAGDQFGDASSITFRNCIASDISGQNVTYGFFLGADNFNIYGTQVISWNRVVENCVAQRISNTSSVFDVVGIGTSMVSTFGPNQQFPVLRNLYIRGCRVSDVRSNNANPSPLSAGIMAFAVTRPDIIENSVSDCDRGILLTGTNLLTPNTGFQLAYTKAYATAMPPVFIPVTSTGKTTQTFHNTTQGNILTTTADQVQPLTGNFIGSTTDLNKGTGLGWQPGDTIVYTGDGTISPLVNNTTYYAIVYSPGFSKNGLIKDNEVDNCSISGFQDATPLPNKTSSAWISNIAFNCGNPPGNNYAINFSGIAPIDSGTLSNYPLIGNKYYNLSLMP